MVASLAGCDVVDATTVSFLLRENLRRKKMEEEEKERRRVLEEKAKAKEAEKMEAQMLQLSERIRNDMPLTESEWAAWYRWQAPSSSSGRKRKKRKKKKLPRGGRAHRRQRQWQVPRWFPGFDASHAVFPSSVGMPELPGILAGVYLKDSGVLFVVSGSGMSQAGFAGISPRAVFFSIVAWSQMLRITAVLDQKECLAFLTLAVACYASLCVPFGCRQARGRVGMDQKINFCLAGFAGDDTSCAVFSSFSSGPDALHIMASMTQVNRCLEEYLTIGFFWEMTSYLSLFCSLVRQWIHIYVSLQRPGLCTELQKTAEFPQLQFIAGRRHLFRGAEAVSQGSDRSSDHRYFPVAVRGDPRPCCAGREGSFPNRGAEAVSYGPDRSSDHRYSPVAEFGGSCSCCAGRAGSLPCRDAEADSHGPACLADHRDFAGAVRAGWSMSLVRRSSWIPSAVVKETAEISQLLLLRNRWLPVVLAALRGGVGMKGIF